MGLSYAGLAIKSRKDGLYLVYSICKNAGKGKPEQEKVIEKLNTNTVFIRVKVVNGAKCTFSYSLNGQQFTDVKEVFQAEVGQWIGAKMGIFCTQMSQTNDSSYADFDWFRVEPI